MTKILKNAHAVHGRDQEAEAAILGSLVWWTLRDIRITRKQLEAAFADAGLSKQYLPHVIRESDAFRRATKAIQGTKDHANGDQKVVAILVRDVGEKDDEIIRKVVRETRNLAGRRLSYDEIADLGFDKESKSLELNGPQAICREVEKTYVEFLDHYTGDHLRRMVKNVVDSLDPTRVRPTGAVYFIPRHHAATVDALANVLQGIERRGRAVGGFDSPSSLESVLLIDSTKHREFLLSKFAQQTDEDLEWSVKDLAAILRGDQEITMKAAQKWVERLKALRETASRYEGLLEAKLDATKTKIGTLELQVVKLIDKLAADEASRSSAKERR